MRTDDEILARIKEVAPDDWLGTQRSDLVGALSFSAARPFFRDLDADDSPSAWEAERTATPEKVLAAIRDYLPFAIEKATDHRGISAGRSVDHFHAWVWLLGDAPYSQINWDNYPNYGAPILKAVAELAGCSWPTSDADHSLNRMANGLPCTTDCDEGCN